MVPENHRAVQTWPVQAPHKQWRITCLRPGCGSNDC